METAITEKITQDQEKQLNRFHEDFLHKLGFTKDEAQRLIANFHLIKPDLEKVYQKHAIADKRYGAALIEFELTVPADYNHDTQLDTFAKKNKKSFAYYNDALTSKNFAKATVKLVPGKKYKVKIFPILETVTSEDNMAFLKTQRAILVGGQGISLTWDLHKDKFPKGKYTVSFDEKEALWKDSDGNHLVPFLYARSGGDFEFLLGFFGSDWGAVFCILCFCEIEQPLES